MSRTWYRAKSTMGPAEAIPYSEEGWPQNWYVIAPFKIDRVRFLSGGKGCGLTMDGVEMEVPPEELEVCIISCGSVQQLTATESAVVQFPETLIWVYGRGLDAWEDSGLVSKGDKVVMKWWNDD